MSHVSDTIGMEVDTWQSAYEAAERLHRSILAEIGDRGRLPRSSLGYTHSTQRLRSMSSDLTSELSDLRQSLGKLGPQLTSHELNRLISSKMEYNKGACILASCSGDGICWRVSLEKLGPSATPSQTLAP